MKAFLSTISQNRQIGRASNDGKHYLFEEIIGLEIDTKLPRTAVRISHGFWQYTTSYSSSNRSLC